MIPYNFKMVEKKWHQNNGYPVASKGDQPTFYCLDMLPAPLQSPLPAGQWRGLVLGDVICRYKTLQGYRVVRPIGWNAFAGHDKCKASRRGEDPKALFSASVDKLKEELNGIGAIFDWSLEFNTGDPDYIRCTQWLFQQLHKAGLVYQTRRPLYFCETCQRALAHGELENGSCCYCGGIIQIRNTRQWLLRVSDCAARLLESLGTLEWPDKMVRKTSSLLKRQLGMEVNFLLPELSEQIKVFTTTPELICGVTYLAISPKHPLVEVISAEPNRAQVRAYVEQDPRPGPAKGGVVTGVNTGYYGFNPLTGERVPIWITDSYAYEQKAIGLMGVPAHNPGDFQFAQEFDLPIRPVTTISEELPSPPRGELINSGKFIGLNLQQAHRQITSYLATQGMAELSTQDNTRHLEISRPGLWGEPIPLIHCEDCGEVLIPEEHLPVKVREQAQAEVTPLEAVESWVDVPCSVCGGNARRETAVMTQWLGASWSFLGPSNPDPSDNVRKLGQVDLYIGEFENTVVVSTYARFLTMFLRDLGVIRFTEPIRHLLNPGAITTRTGREHRMVPSSLIEHYGADAFRVYLSMMGPPEREAQWQDEGIEGAYRFIEKVWNLVQKSLSQPKEATKGSERLRAKLITDVSERLESHKFNTAVSAFMEYLNQIGSSTDKASLKTLAVMLAPFAPFVAEEIWQQLGCKNSVFQEEWPAANREMLIDEETTIVIQVDGKLRGTLLVPIDSPEDSIKTQALRVDAVRHCLRQRTVVRYIYVKDKLLNLVTE